jgi:hypothetical protein
MKGNRKLILSAAKNCRLFAVIDNEGDERALSVHNQGGTASNSRPCFAGTRVYFLHTASLKNGRCNEH